jgi:hypothetical protein
MKDYFWEIKKLLGFFQHQQIGNQATFSSRVRSQNRSIFRIEEKQWF